MMGLGVMTAHSPGEQVSINIDNFSGDFHWFSDFNKNKCKNLSATSKVLNKIFRIPINLRKPKVHSGRETKLLKMVIRTGHLCTSSPLLETECNGTLQL